MAPNSAFAQSSSTAVLLTGATESLALEASGTTAKLINFEPVKDPQTASGQPRRIINQHANFSVSTPEAQTAVNQQTSGTMEDLPTTPPQSKPVAAAKTNPLPTRTNTALPTVIVRPPAEGFFEGDGVSVDVDRVDENSPDEFSVKLRVPHSVKVIEVTPIQNGSVAQNYKIRLTQKPDGRHITSEVAHLLEKTPGELVSNQISPLPPKPIETRPGFQRNPFFNSDSPVPPKRVAALSKTVSRQPNLVENAFRQIYNQDLRKFYSANGPDSLARCLGFNERKRSRIKRFPNRFEFHEIRDPHAGRTRSGRSFKNNYCSTDCFFQPS